MFSAIGKVAFGALVGRTASSSRAVSFATHGCLLRYLVSNSAGICLNVCFSHPFHTIFFPYDAEVCLPTWRGEGYGPGGCGQHCGFCRVLQMLLPNELPLVHLARVVLDCEPCVIITRWWATRCKLLFEVTVGGLWVLPQQLAVPA
jgi:hypothetical protein